MTREEKSIRREFLIRIDAGFKDIKPMQRRAMVEILFICKNEIEARGLTKEDFCKNEDLREHTLLLKNMGVKVKDGIKCANEISTTHWIYNIGDKDLRGTNVYTKAAYTEGNNYITISINKCAMEKIYHVAVEPMDNEIAEYKSVKPQYATPENVTQGMIYCMNFLTQKQKEVLMTIWRFYKEKKANPLTIPFLEIMNFKDTDMIIMYKYDTKETGFVTRYLISDYICKDGDVKLFLNDDAVYELFECSELTTLESEEETH
jgi:hypothetical protein